MISYCNMLLHEIFVYDGTVSLWWVYWWRGRDRITHLQVPYNSAISSSRCVLLCYIYACSIYSLFAGWQVQDINSTWFHKFEHVHWPMVFDWEIIARFSVPNHHPSHSVSSGFSRVKLLLYCSSLPDFI